MSQQQLQIQLVSRVPLSQSVAIKVLTELRIYLFNKYQDTDAYYRFEISVFPSGEVIGAYFHEVKNFVINKKESLLTIETKDPTYYISLGCITSVSWKE